MKCRDCKFAKRGYFASVPDAYVCIGVREPFVIPDYPNRECSEYPISHVGIINANPDKFATDNIPDQYESPITIYTQQISAEYNNGILKAVQSYFPDINKDELAKALNYDRDQYKKGYADGVRNMKKKFMNAIADILKELEE